MNVLRVRLAPYGLQSVHVYPAHAYSKDLDASSSCLSSDLFHGVLRPPVSHNHGNPWDVQVCWSCSLFLSEGGLHCELDGQTSHGPCGKVLHVPHGLLHLSLSGIRVEGELRLDDASVLEQTDPCVIRANVEELN